jgi:hypothetical protein
VPTITYSNPTRCQGGGHTAFDVAINGGAAKRTVFTTDEIRAPLSGLTAEEQETLKLLILKVHFAGKSRAQIVTEVTAGPVVVTI